MNEQAASQLKGPAIALMVAGALEAAFSFLRLLLQILGVGFGALGSSADAEGVARMMSGGLGIVAGLVGLAVAGFVVFAGMQMMKGSQYNLCMAGAIVAMIPCFSPCCCIRLPIGIWALVILMKPEIKAAFVD
jgi:hypothetical protein